MLDVYPVFLKLGWKHLCFLCFWSVTKLLLFVFPVFLNERRKHSVFGVFHDPLQCF